MTCEACRAAVLLPGVKVDNINACHPEACGCEAFSIAEGSPGRVQDHEVLHFMVPTPEGRYENGKLNPIFLRQVDVNGLSVLREGASDSEFEQTMGELLPRWQDKKRRLEGIVSFPASIVRRVDEKRLCCVYDTALPGKPHHADLMMPPVIGAANPKEIERARKVRIKMLVDRIGVNFQSTAEFRDGRLAHLED